MSITKVAQIAGFSHTTVARVINNDASVSPETADKIRRAMQEIGYTPKPPSMRRGPRRSKDANFKTGNVAFLVANESLQIISSSPIMSELVHGIEDALASYGMSMVQGVINSTRDLPPIVTRGQVDGIIVWPDLRGVREQTINALRSHTLVYVMTGHYAPIPADRVLSDNYRIGSIAAEHLIRKGCRNLCYITASSLNEIEILRQRWTSFYSDTKRAGVSARQIVIEQTSDDLLAVNDKEDAAIAKALEQLFNSDDRPDGFFVACDSLTAKLYPFLLRLGIAIGEQLQVVSCNNEFAFLAGLEPRPLTIDIHPEQIGRKAVEQLRWRLSNLNQTARVTVEVQPTLCE